MPDTDRLINKDQGDSIIAAIHGITSRLQEMYTVDDALSGTSENPVQNKVVTAALDNKVDNVEGKGLSTNDYTNAEKALVATIPNKADADDVTGTKTASGNPITLTDCAPINAESLVVELEPQQDLHGHDFPWVGGAGKNKYTGSPSFDGFEQLNYWSKQTETYNGHEVYKRTGAWSGCYSLVTLPVGDYVFSCMVKTSDGASINIFNKLDGVTTAEVSSNTLFVQSSTTWSKVQFAFSVTQAGTVACRVERGENGDVYISEYQLESGSQATDYAPFSNICPITGYTGVEVLDRGINQWDEEWELGTISVSDGSKTSSNTNIRSKNYIPVMGGETYYFTSYQLRMPACYDENKIFISAAAATAVGSSGWLLTMPENAKYMLFDMSTNYGTTYLNNLSLNKPNTDHEYHAYASTSATIQFGQTVYGGSVDFNSGVVTVTHLRSMLTNLTKEYFSNGTYSTAYRGILPVSANTVAYTQPHGAISNMGTEQVSYWGSPRENEEYSSNAPFFAISPTGEYLIVYDNSTTITESDFLTKYNDFELCYPIAEPFTIQLTPQELKLLKGTNHITTNGTTITLGYQPDNVIGEVKGEIQEIKEMPYLRILDNDVDTEIKNYRLYYRFISSAYTLVNLEEMLRHRFIFVEVINNPSGTANHELLHSALIDPRTIDGFEYGIDAGSGDTICIESIIAENKFALSVRYTGSHTSGDPTDYYVTIRMVD